MSIMGTVYDLERDKALGLDRDSLLKKNAELRAALKAMIECHGKPHREEWLNDAAFEHAKQVDAQARSALEK